MIIEQDDFIFNYSDKIHGETIQFVNCHTLSIECCVLENYKKTKNKKKYWISKKKKQNVNRK